MNKIVDAIKNYSLVVSQFYMYYYEKTDDEGIPWFLALAAILTPFFIARFFLPWWVSATMFILFMLPAFCVFMVAIVTVIHHHKKNEWEK